MREKEKAKAISEQCAATITTRKTLAQPEPYRRHQSKRKSCPQNNFPLPKPRNNSQPNPKGRNNEIVQEKSQKSLRRKNVFGNWNRWKKSKRKGYNWGTENTIEDEEGTVSGGKISVSEQGKIKIKVYRVSGAGLEYRQSWQRSLRLCRFGTTFAVWKAPTSLNGATVVVLLLLLVWGFSEAGFEDRSAPLNPLYLREDTSKLEPILYPNESQLTTNNPAYKRGRTPEKMNPDLSQDTLSNLLSHLNPFLWQQGCRGRMSKEKKSYKQAICAMDASQEKKEKRMENVELNNNELKKLNKDQGHGAEQSKKQETTPHGDEKRTQEKEKLKNKQPMDQASTNKEEKHDRRKTHVKGKGKLLMDEKDLQMFRAELKGVKENIEKLKEVSLYGFVIGDYLDMETLKAKLDKDCWRPAGGRYQVFPKAEGWFEFRFNNPIDKNWVWDSRPYHVYGNLLLLKPWSPNFDPKTVSTTVVDMWIRILQLPPEFISSKVLKTVVEKNNLGKFIRLDSYTEKGINVRFPRICINMDVKNIRSDQIVIPDDSNEVKTYTVWFEEFPKGYGNCGKLDHLFEDCPLLNYSFKPVKVILPKGLNPRTKTQTTAREKDAEVWKRMKNRSDRPGDTRGDTSRAEMGAKQIFLVEHLSSSSHSASKESNPSVKGSKKDSAEKAGKHSSEENSAKTKDDNMKKTMKKSPNDNLQADMNSEATMTEMKNVKKQDSSDNKD